eukprot:4747198-Pyramimonas_sp.AAC.1
MPADPLHEAALLQCRRASRPAEGREGAEEHGHHGVPLHVQHAGLEAVQVGGGWGAWLPGRWCGGLRAVCVEMLTGEQPPAALGASSARSTGGVGVNPPPSSLTLACPLLQLGRGANVCLCEA